MTKEDIIDYLVSESEGDYTREELEKDSPIDLFSKWLEWEGIFGYTQKMVKVVEALWEVELKMGY